MRVIGIKVGPEGGRRPTSIVWHASAIDGSNYDTLCATDGLDPTTGTFGFAEPAPEQKITCTQCWQIWRGVHDLKLCESDFARTLR